MSIYVELLKEIDRINASKIEGFDSDWVLMFFARKQSLINISLIKPYTNKYNLIVRYLVTGNPDIKEEAYKACSDAVVNSTSNELAHSEALAASKACAGISSVYDAVACSADASNSLRHQFYKNAIDVLKDIESDYLLHLDPPI